MISRRACMILALGCLLLVFTVPSLAQETAPAYQVVAYFSSWGIYDRQYFVTDIPADMVTTINYAFAFISDDGEIMLGDEWADTQYLYPGDKEDEPLLGNFKQLQLLKAAHPNLRTVISVGGWTGSAKFSDAALTDESRKKFAGSCVDFITKYGFDGVDIDWEYPTGGGDSANIERPEDAANFILMLKELRTQLDAQGTKDGKHYLLTIAAAAGKDGYSKLDMKQIYPLLDWINVMTYDFSGSWSDVTGFNAPLYDSTDNPPEGGSADSIIQGYEGAGVPAERLVMGVPFYGRGWTGVANTDNGLHQAYTGFPDGSEDGGLDYRALVDSYIPTYQRYWNDVSQVPWLYDAASKTMISYDDPESLKMKVGYVKEKGLGGVMIWELASDDSDHSLLTALHDALVGN